jgi:hypothetical protein
MTTHEIRKSYTFVRLANVNQDRAVVTTQLDNWLGDHQDLPGFSELPDRAWLLVVHRLYITELRKKLISLFPLCEVNPDYDPTEPSAAEVVHCGSYHLARWKKEEEFLSQADLMAHAWPIASTYYSIWAEEIRARISIIVSTPVLNMLEEC